MKATNGGENRFSAMARVYDKMAPKLVPQYNFLHDELLGLLSFSLPSNLCLVDLGAGSGRLIERILAADLVKKCYWVDSSQDFLAVAKSRLETYGDRVEYILSPLEDDWASHIPENVDAIVSMSAIHHLESNEKSFLYARCFDKLISGGWFFNIDEAKTLYGDSYLSSLRYWVRYVDQKKEALAEQELPDYTEWNVHFTKWKERNLDCADRPKSKGDDIHESFMTQLGWLDKAGFVNVDVFVKFHLWCMMGGRKPQ